MQVIISVMTMKSSPLRLVSSNEPTGPNFVHAARVAAVVCCSGVKQRKKGADSGLVQTVLVEIAASSPGGKRLFSCGD
jgi:hypothetical protein